MAPRPSKASRELIALYRRASHGEHNIGTFLEERPELVSHLGVCSEHLADDDAALALYLAPAIGRYKSRLAHDVAAERAIRAADVAQAIARSARSRDGRFEIDTSLLLGELLVDGTKKYISFELPAARVEVPRALLLRARGALRELGSVTAAIDPLGLHLAWRGGRGGLHFRPHELRGASHLVVDLREVRQNVRAPSPAPVPLFDILASLGFA